MRRGFLLLVLALLGCGGQSIEAEEDDMGFPLSPWHMWGTGQTLQPTVSALPSPDNMISQQLARVNYARPETWTFLFAAHIAQAHTVSPASSIQVGIYFDLIVGVGRSQFTMPQFGELVFVGNAAALTESSRKWTTVVQAPELFEPTPSFRPTIDKFPAEDIQCSARVYAFQGGGGPVVGDKVSVQVEAFFAPLNHIRPEWYALSGNDSARFRGEENKGK